MDEFIIVLGIVICVPILIFIVLTLLSTDNSDF